MKFVEKYTFPTSNPIVFVKPQRWSDLKSLCFMVKDSKLGTNQRSWQPAWSLHNQKRYFEMVNINI